MSPPPVIGNTLLASGNSRRKVRRYNCRKHIKEKRYVIAAHRP
jgi:hypothetical protein